MKKVLIINVSANSGSTGRIAENIGRTAIANGFDSYFAYGRIARDSQCKLIRIGSDKDIRWHGLQSRIFDNQGFASTKATQLFVEKIKRIQPDIINIHNIHGYYANIDVLLNYLATTNIPVVWTLHDCWNFTGHCAFFDYAGCDRWKTHCHHCPRKKGYPSSYVFDSSSKNYEKKKALFGRMHNLHFVTPSQWLADLTKESFLSQFPVHVINNGLDLSVFKPIVNERTKSKMGIQLGQKVILGVASVWHKRKGLDDFIQLAKALPEHKVVLVGLTEKQVKELPQGMVGVTRTENTRELAELYSMADVFVNPTYADNFPTTNIEALACGTPVITYKTGGSPEAVDAETGLVVEKGSMVELIESVRQIMTCDREQYRTSCRNRAVQLYDKRKLFQDYIDLFNSVLNETD